MTTADFASTPITQLHRHLGARPVGDGTEFCVWSPTSDTVTVHLVDTDRMVPLEKGDGGYFSCRVDGVGAGDRYAFRFDNGPDRPDPASRFQPDGVHGPSMVVDPAFEWTDDDWKPVAREDLVIYELHVGTFTDGGTFCSAIDRLDELVELGITAIELLPVADAAGRWNWGYDGVNLFAPNRNYGTPDEFRALVDAAHAKGLAVFLDVVYNHLGPEGNYLGESGPYLSTTHHTVWGSAPNFDDVDHGPQLRRFIIANAVYWFDEFHVDGLRVDAIHCMFDTSPRHVVKEMAAAVHAYADASGRTSMLIAESNVHDKTMLLPLADDGCGFDAQWSDDFLHGFFAVVRPGEKLCHRDYESLSDLDQVLRMGYVYEGTLASQRGRVPMGDRVDTGGLIYSIQNHDFIGNHPTGKRLHQATSKPTQAAAAAMLILSPALPMLFMGEEFACEHPFAFFVDFGDENLRQAVVEGRRREYPHHDWDRGASPINEQAFYESKIGPTSAGDASMRSWYRSLIAARRDWVGRGLLRGENVSVQSNLKHGVFVMTYRNDADVVSVAVRLSPETGTNEAVDLDSIGIECMGNVVMDSSDNASDTKALLPNHAKVYA